MDRLTLSCSGVGQSETVAAWVATAICLAGHDAGVRWRQYREAAWFCFARRLCCASRLAVHHPGVRRLRRG
eukprot:8513564-Lingulodinium_polyedra.AAC.1